MMAHSKSTLLAGCLVLLIVIVAGAIALAKRKSAGALREGYVPAYVYGIPQANENHRCLCEYAVDCPCLPKCGMAATWAGPSMSLLPVTYDPPGRK
jgi:hypothetical protein